MFPSDQQLQQQVACQHPEMGAGWRVQRAGLRLGDVRATASELVHRQQVLRLGGEGNGVSPLERAIEEATVLLEPPDHCVFVQLQRGPFAVLATVPFKSITEDSTHWKKEQAPEDRVFRFEALLFAHARFGAGNSGRGSIGTHEQLVHLLADLRHWCDIHGVDTRELFDKSYEQFMVERHGGLKGAAPSGASNQEAVDEAQQR